MTIPHFKYVSYKKIFFFSISVVFEITITDKRATLLMIKNIKSVLGIIRIYGAWKLVRRLDNLKDL